MPNVKPLPLEQYHKEVSEHLQYIEHGASMVCRRVGMLSRTPGFRARAQDEMERAEQTLADALEKIRTAKVGYASKPQESSHAMHAV